MNKKIGIFVDCENISKKTISGLFSEIEEMGEIVISQGFSSLFESNHSGWYELRNFLSLVKCEKYGSAKKNSTDMKLAIHCMKETFVHDLDLIFIVSSDIDFVPLAHILQSMKKEVFIVGNQKNEDQFINQQIKFIEIDKIKRLNKVKNDIIKIIYRIVFENAMNNNFDPIPLSFLQDKIKKQDVNKLNEDVSLIDIIENIGYSLKENLIFIDTLNINLTKIL